MNTGSLRCPVCDGTGTISLDVQFLPDVDIPCPECHGSRYGKQAKRIRYTNKDGQECSLPELMNMFKEVADIKTSDQLHLPVPEARFETVVVQPSEHQQAMVAELSERAAAVHSGVVMCRIGDTASWCKAPSCCC